ncbi:NHLP bacteriocin export ABC transporter permease/ATPase subunit [Alcaligenaceae bacterium]|nr:NHLP bacteriocin export ABC transporter permease/ATPase subunit [Alcaligenaceae bacterium]
MDSSRTDRLASCGPGLQALLDASSPPLAVAGNTPFPLDETDTCWWLERGCIELFLVEIRNGEPHGQRHHFATIQPGTLLFGLPQEEAPGPGAFVVLAVPHVDTEVRRIALAQLRAAPAAAVPDLAGAVDHWIEAVSAGLARWAAPSPVIHQSIQPDTAFAMATNTRIASGGGIVWLDVPRHAALFLSTQELPAGPHRCLVPLSRSSWLQAGEPLELLGCDSMRLLSGNLLWAGLETLHRLLIPTARLNLMLATVDEHNRLRQRSDSARREWRQGLGALQNVLESGIAGNALLDDRQPALALALQAVGRHEGFDVRLPARRRQRDEDEAPGLEAIVQASGLRSRLVALDAGWERYDTQAMLGFAKDDGRPLAILPQAHGELQVFDPERRQTLRGRDALALLAPTAYAFTAPLPSRKLGWRALSRFSLARGWRDLCAFLLTALCGGLLAMAVPIGSAYLIDTVIPGHDRNHLLQVGLILAVLGITTFIMSYVGGIAFSRFQSRTAPALQAAIVDRLLRLPARFFRHFSAGDLAVRATAITHIDQLVSSSAAQALMGGVFAIFSFTLLLYYDWRLGLWAALLTALYTIATLALIWMQLRHQRHLAQNEGALQGLSLQMVTGISKIRLSASEDRAFARWATLFSRSQTLRNSAAAYQNMQTALNSLFGLAALFLFFLVLGAYRDPGQADVLAVGGFAAFLAAFNHFSGSITQMTQTAAGLMAVQPLLERALPILSASPETADDKDDPGTLSGAVEVTQLSFRYAPDAPLVLDDITLSARAGEFVAIVGASGCGKSTLLRLLLGFEAAETGGILLDGQDMRELDILAVRRQMGVVLQNSHPIPGSLYENIVGTTRAGLDDAWDAARKVGLAEDIRRMPMGMHTAVTEGGSLSGGQIQRLMIARAIVGQPRILLLDEATSALDNRAQAVVTDSLDRLSITRIVIAHRLSTVAKADRIYVMDAGRVVEQGNYEQLMSTDGHFARLAAAQLL